jgi:hypothetical protein
MPTPSLLGKSVGFDNFSFDGKAYLQSRDAAWVVVIKVYQSYQGSMMACVNSLRMEDAQSCEVSGRNILYHTATASISIHLAGAQKRRICCRNAKRHALGIFGGQAA